MKNDQLLAEIDDIIRTMPSLDDFRRLGHETLPWVGRAAAAIQRWNGSYTDASEEAVNGLQSQYYVGTAFKKMLRLLHQARADLRMEVGKLSVVVAEGRVFEYFEELRNFIGTARAELFFVDPYLDAEFVGNYLPQVANGVTVRPLGGKKMATLLPSVDLFAKESGMTVQVRSSTALHDRYLFVDGGACYLSGASFKDGAKYAPATLTQIVDGFSSMWDTYDRLWNAAKVER